MVLLEKPDLLLLDEPTNHLDAETIQWLEQTLREYPGTVIIVTHDRYFLDNITKWILELEGGRGLPFEGNYSSWLAQKAELLRIIEKRETQRQKTLQRELEWIQKSHHGRLQKNEARVKAYEQLASEQIDPTSETIIQIAPGPRLGEKVLQFKDVRKGFDSGGERLRLLEDCSFNLPRGAIVGVIGPNGTGKTTLLRMIVGQEQPDAGAIDLGPSVVLSYVDQHRDALDDSRTVFDEITDGADRIELGDVSVNARAYVARFNFRGSQQQKKVGECSGGERNRIHLAKMLRRGGNLLLLDEPTNDLDVATMRVLEQAMISFAGCAMVISHDRFFLDRICTHLLVMEGDGQHPLVRGQFRPVRGGGVGREPRAFRPPPREVPTADRQAALSGGSVRSPASRLARDSTDARFYESRCALRSDLREALAMRGVARSYAHGSAPGQCRAHGGRAVVDRGSRLSFPPSRKGALYEPPARNVLDLRLLAAIF